MFRKTLLTCGLVLILAACNLSVATPGSGVVPGGPTLDQAGAVQQAVAQTFDAQTQIAGVVQQTLAALATDTPQFTWTPSSTFTPTLTFTPTFTLTQAVSLVSVSVETNCRSGPGTAYDVLGVLRVGESAELVGRDAYGGNWIIKLPSKPGVTCWVWAQYATTTGNTAALPAFTPPPTPTPVVNFVLSYDSFTTCGGMFAVKFKIVNNGSLTWESDQVNATDRTTAVTKTINRNSFPNYNGCAIGTNDNNLEPGEVGITTSSGFAANPAGHDFSATIQVCSSEGLAGTCLAKTVTFTP